MNELERLEKEAIESMVKYVKLNDEYKAKLPMASKNMPRWVSLQELDEIGKAVNEAQSEWHKKLRRYIEQRDKNK
jgi:hypothetical protein